MDALGKKGLPAPHLALEQNGLTGFGERLCSADHFLHGPTGMVDILKAAVGQIAVEPVAFPQSPGTLPLYLVHLVKREHHSTCSVPISHGGGIRHHTETGQF